MTPGVQTPCAFIFTILSISSVSLSTVAIDSWVKTSAKISPRLLTKEQAATYCGVSAATFSTVCPVTPIALNQSKKLRRYDLQLLDKWIDGLAWADTLTDSDWLAKMDERDDDGGKNSRH
jgi:hypothetical protein